MFIEFISLGTVNQTFVEPMEVFSLALQKRAVSILLCHNHPSGELKPSEADKDITNRLIQVGKIVKTKVIDHIIISENSYLSFEDVGLMESLKRSDKYVPGYQRTKEIKKEAAEIARRKEKVEIAKEMKRANEPIEKIVAFTGLSPEEVENLKVRMKR